MANRAGKLFQRVKGCVGCVDSVYEHDFKPELPRVFVRKDLQPAHNGLKVELAVRAVYFFPGVFVERVHRRKDDVGFRQFGAHVRIGKEGAVCNDGDRYRCEFFYAVEQIAQALVKGRFSFADNAYDVEFGIFGQASFQLGDNIFNGIKHVPLAGHVQRSAELTVSAGIIAGFFGNGTYAERTPQPARGHRPEYKARVFHKAFQPAII